VHPLSCRKLAPAGSDENVGFTHAFGSGCASAKSFLDVFIAVVVVVVVVLVVVVVAENNNNENNRKKIDDIALVARERPSRPREDTISSRARVTPSSPSLLSLSLSRKTSSSCFSVATLFFRRRRRQSWKERITKRETFFLLDRERKNALTARKDDRLRFPVKEERWCSTARRVFVNDSRLVERNLERKKDDCEISPEGSGRRDDGVNERDVPLFSSIETSFFLRERCSIARSKQRER
jgi:hypothetical protein